ncbi:MAG: hypothetical protein CL424_09115 [Acidimicrobiaceae bacterium]|nr:hypothetical protein [Acidimicrobiaceae bacterium]
MTMTEESATSTTVEDRWADLVDCDAHFTEPADLWSARVPAGLQGSVPAQRTVDGHTAWYLNGELWASIGGNTIGVGRQKKFGTHVIQPFDLVDESSWDVTARLSLMDEMGVKTQIIYPNGVGFSSNHLHAIDDLGQRTLVLETYNDFLADIQEESGGRLLPQAVLPVWDMDQTIQEMTRLLDRGIRGFTLSDKPELLGLPELPRPYWTPMWDLFNSSGAVANFHIGAGATREDVEAMRAGTDASDPDAGVKHVKPAWNSLSRQRRLAAHSTQMYMSNVRIIINFCYSDILDRFPNLKIVSAESGIGWIPFVLEAAEWQLDEMVTDHRELTSQSRRPTELFRDHFYVMFWFETIGAERLIDAIGVNNILIETDVPHPTCLYPNPREHFQSVLGHLPDADLARILRDNANELYRVG